MGRPDDANPLNASLASESIRRQPKAQKKENSAETAVTLDRKAVLALNASQRQKWLSKALRQAVDGRLSAPQLYDVVSAAKFADGIEEKVGRRMCHWLRDHLTLFTNRQQRQLQDQAAIFTKFRAPRSESEGDRRQREPSEPRDEEAVVASSSAAAASETSEDMMSRIREFMRGKAHERDCGGGGVEDAAAGPSKAERRAARAFLDGTADEPATSSALSKEPRKELNGGKISDPAAEAQPPAASRSASVPRRRAGSRSRSQSRSGRRRKGKTKRAPSRSGSSGSSVGQRGKQLSRSRSRSASRGKRAGEQRSRSSSRQRFCEEKQSAGEKGASSTSLRRRVYAQNRPDQPSPPRAGREHKERECAGSKSRRGRSATSSSSRRSARSRSRSSPSRRGGRHKKERDKGRDKVRERDMEKGKDKDRR